jgi:hypothetical protein
MKIEENNKDDEMMEYWERYRNIDPGETKAYMVSPRWNNSQK